jgi:DNA-binding MarR family transcriptional regulator
MVSVQESQAHGQASFHPTHEIDVELLTFVERYATNLARWDLLVYFGQHPTRSDDVEGIARCVGRLPPSIQKELDDLAYLGILCARANGKGKLYALTRAPHMRRAVLRLAQHYRAASDQC